MTFLSETYLSETTEEDQLLLPLAPPTTTTVHEQDLFLPFRPFDFIQKTSFTPPPVRKQTVNAPRTPLGYSNLFEATYSSVEVYEFTINDTAVMRRKHDHFINATHILKAAGYDKGPRTKILEKEVHHELHEKVQGGYGRYQGTWIPLERAKTLARDYQIYELLAPILDL